MDSFGLDNVVPKLAALGVPAFIFVVAYGSAAAAGLAGAAAFTATLAAIGPAGMIGGLVTLGAIGLLSQVLAEHGADAIAKALVHEFVKNGDSAENIKEKVSHYPFTQGLKLKLNELVENETKSE